jgi:hypothetical protein
MNITITVLAGLEIREYGRGDPLRWPRDILYPQKVGTKFVDKRGREVGVVRSRTKATEFFITVPDVIHRPVFYLLV